MTTWLHNAIKPKEFLTPLPLPRRYADATLEDIPVSSLVTCARKYGKAFWDVAPAGIAPLFVGSGGKWKTTTAAVIARAVRNTMQLDVGWCNCAADFVQFDRDAFSDTTRDRIAFLKAVPFLVLDDFTQVKTGSRMLDTLVEIGTMRYDEQRPTLWTGNIALSKKYDQTLIDAVGVCLARRIFDGAEGFTVVVKAS